MHTFSLRKILKMSRGFLGRSGMFGLLDMALCVVTKKIRFRNARIERRPVYI
jgi:hypothetical protein